MSGILKLRWAALIVMLICNASYAQDSYQASVNEGFGIRVSAVGDIWKGAVITDRFVTNAGLDLTAAYGFTENIGIFGGYQYLFPSGLDAKEIGYLIYTENVRHQNFTAGLKYFAGSPSQKMRVSVGAGLMFAQTVTEIFQDQHDIYLDVRLKGLGFHGGVGIDYFLSPFFSTALNLSYNAGKYRSSEYLGITYKESLKWSRIQCSLGINYHFAGR